MVSENENPDEGAGDEWDGTWKGTERAQLEAALTATPAQRLVWLEEAMRLAHASGALPGQSQDQIEPSTSKDD